MEERDLRVSDAEREHVVAVLQRAIGRGMLDLDEFTQRTDTALAARTRGELNAVLVDLPGLTHDTVPSGVASTPPAELTAGVSTIVRNGHWTVPRQLTVRNNMGGVRLDFSRARFESEQVLLELDVGMGSVRLTLPREATVNTEGLTLSMGHLRGHASSAEEPGSRHFVITGSVRMGSVHIRRRR
ncbi:MAG: DUF1707 SHOCT-like domain-containing protein [Sciscionella sp.]